MEWQQILFGKHLEPNESLMFVAHKHWIELLRPSLITGMFGFLVPWSVWVFFPAFFWVAVVWSAVFWCWYLYNFVNWYFDAWLVTDYSVINVEWKGIFHQLSARIPYSELREISWEVKGILGTILRYGDASISMATGGKVTLQRMNQPKVVELKLIEIRDRYNSKQKFSDSDVLKDLLSELVARHVKDNNIRFRKAS